MTRAPARKRAILPSIRCVSFLTAACGIFLPVLAQKGPTPNPPAHKTTPRLKWLPYTATYKEVHTVTYNSRAPYTSSSIKIEARDSQGRSLQILITPWGPPGGTSAWSTVSDPVARANVDWPVYLPAESAPVAPDQPRVRFAPWPAPAAAQSTCTDPAPGPAPTAPAIPDASAPALTTHEKFDELRAWMRSRPPTDPQAQSKSVNQDLGRKTIKGIEVRGYRDTTTRTNSQTEHGSAKPDVSIWERWRDVNPGMGFLEVLYKSETSRGTYTRELMSVKLGEPDPNLFHPPADYEVVTKAPPQPACASQSPPVAPASQPGK
jgi:hypothetical protein